MESWSILDSSLKRWTETPTIMPVCVKVYYTEKRSDGALAEEIRRFTFRPADPMEKQGIFQNLLDRIRSVFNGLNLHDFNLCWKDEDGDYVVFSSDDELKVAMNSIHDNTLRLYIKAKDTPQPRLRPHANACISIDRGGGSSASNCPTWNVLPPPPAIKREDSDFNNEHDAPPGLTNHVGSSNEESPPGSFLCCRCHGEGRGVWYKCTICPNYFICSDCEHSGFHDHHMIIRLPPQAGGASAHRRCMQKPPLPLVPRTTIVTHNPNPLPDSRRRSSSLKQRKRACILPPAPAYRSGSQERVTNQLQAAISLVEMSQVGSGSSNSGECAISLVEMNEADSDSSNKVEAAISLVEMSEVCSGSSNRVKAAVSFFEMNKLDLTGRMSSFNPKAAAVSLVEINQLDSGSSNHVMGKKKSSNPRAATISLVEVRDMQEKIVKSPLESSNQIKASISLVELDSWIESSQVTENLVSSIHITSSDSASISLVEKPVGTNHVTVSVENPILANHVTESHHVTNFIGSDDDLDFLDEPITSDHVIRAELQLANGNRLMEYMEDEDDLIGGQGELELANQNDPRNLGVLLACWLLVLNLLFNVTRDALGNR